MRPRTRQTPRNPAARTLHPRRPGHGSVHGIEAWAETVHKGFRGTISRPQFGCPTVAGCRISRVLEATEMTKCFSPQLLDPVQDGLQTGFFQDPQTSVTRSISAESSCSRRRGYGGGAETFSDKRHADTSCTPHGVDGRTTISWIVRLLRRPFSSANIRQCVIDDPSRESNRFKSTTPRRRRGN